MTPDDTDGLPRDALDALRALRTDAPPRATTYRELRDTLHARGAFRGLPRGLAALQYGLAAASLVVAFAAGRLSSAPDATRASDLPAFALFMLNTPAAQYPADIQPADGVEMYRRWAAPLAQAGRLDLGDELARRRFVVDASGSREAAIADGVDGMFVVRAAGVDSALALAATLPHVRFGGAVAVQELMRR